MIKFSLKCDRDHTFESWFQSADAFDKLKASGLVSCAVCGSDAVEKALMAPSVQASRKKAAPRTPATAPTTPPADPAPAATPAAPPGEAAKALAAIKRHIESNSEYVGLKFASQARDMHDGVTPHRPIYGEAKPEEARKLIEDGVPVAPLPFIPTRKTN
ncbi:DUF1178 family protein [Roseovarius aestuariivivens]|uniref:DUF1178 family protein n=1 Tax=Roseovarius aestuariivivens TaxID=1888910 RepID=UPI00107FDF43|nr:DUF1178 family protein [Roseovarius aestuariivivens]